MEEGIHEHLMWTTPTTLLMKPHPGPDKFLRGGNADMQALFGANATDIYRPGAFTKPADVVGDIAGNHLVKPLSNGLTYPAPYTSLPNDPLCVDFASGGNEKLEGAQAPHDIGTGPLAVFFGFSRTTVIHLNAYFGKADTSGVNGYVLSYEATNQTVWMLRTATTFLRLWFSAPPSATRVGILCWRSVTSGLMGVTPSWQADVSQADTTAGQSVTATGGLSLGSAGARWNNAEKVSFLAVCEGAEAEKAIVNRVAGVTAWAALPE
jgi:hypothetical protein